MAELLVVVFVGLGFAELVAWLAIVFQYSVQASVLFRVVITALKGVSMTSAFVLAYLVIEDPDDSVLGMNVLTWLTAFFLSQLAIRWMLNIYVIRDLWSRR
jgi:hypothetical protein